LKLEGGRHELSGLEQKIKSLLDENPYFSLKRMEQILGHHKTTIKKIIIEKLHMQKISTRWVPHFLTPDQMQDREDIAGLM
jgi:predicted HTH transcriptional regulator